jgi:FkbM family methyltransferase
MKIFYGVDNNLVDVTDICFQKMKKNETIIIPFGDENRSKYFKDHLYGTKKKIFIEIDNVFTVYDDYTQIIVDTTTNTITTKNIDTARNRVNINEKLNNIHSKLQIKHGSFDHELPEQKMVVRYLTGKEKVLEIGGNIGRNSLVIASILENDTMLVTLESDVNIANQLIENRDLNNFHFHIECSALSNRRLIQKGWDTIPSNTLLEGYDWVNTITLDNLKTKYNTVFDTLILDCEGAFYYILMDMPEILENINLIIMENDYWDISRKKYIDTLLLDNGFLIDYVESGGWGPCYSNFFEVWRKMAL